MRKTYLYVSTSGQVLYTYRGLAVGSLAWSPEGTYIASVVGITAVQLWQAM